MGFFWQCPGCKKQYFYRGSKTTEAVTTCTPCNLKLKIFQYKIEEKPPETTDLPPKTTNKLPIIKMNGMIEDLIEVLTWCINTIKNKPEVKEKREWSSYYRKYEKWSRYRDYFQSLEEEKSK